MKKKRKIYKMMDRLKGRRMSAKMIKPGQILSFRSGVLQVVKKADHSMLCYIAARLLHKETDYYKALAQITRRDWYSLRGLLYPNFTSEDWTISQETARLIADYAQEYLEEEVGQLRLF